MKEVEEKLCDFYSRRERKGSQLTQGKYFNNLAYPFY
jgi:hypothetical protein